MERKEGKTREGLRKDRGKRENERLFRAYSVPGFSYTVSHLIDRSHLKILQASDLYHKP